VTRRIETPIAAARPHIFEPRVSRHGRPKSPRNRPRNTACDTKKVVHSGGHKPSPVFLRMPCSTVVQELPRSPVGNHSLSARSPENASKFKL
jgi:hypothetical protein